MKQLSASFPLVQSDRKKAQNAMEGAWKAMEKKEKIPWIKKAAEDQKRYEVQYRTVVSDETFWPLTSYLCWRTVKVLVSPLNSPLSPPRPLLGSWVAPGLPGEQPLGLGSTLDMFFLTHFLWFNAVQPYYCLGCLRDCWHHALVNACFHVLDVILSVQFLESCMCMHVLY